MKNLSITATLGEPISLQKAPVPASSVGYCLRRTIEWFVLGGIALYWLSTLLYVMPSNYIQIQLRGWVPLQELRQQEHCGHGNFFPTPNAMQIG